MKLANGAKVIRSKSSVKTSGRIVLAELNDEWIVWNIDKSGDKDRGSYYERYIQAHNDYVSRR